MCVCVCVCVLAVFQKLLYRSKLLLKVVGMGGQVTIDIH